MSVPPGEPVRFRLEGPVARLTIDHPPVNVLTSEVLLALEHALDRADADPAARVVLIDSASPKAFAAGADIRAMSSMGPAESRRHGRAGQSATERIERSPLPVLAAVHGSCLGGGTEIALACDFIFAAEDAVFGQPEIRLGVMPGWGGTQRLPRRIGTVRARDWIMTGRPVRAPEALEAGLLLRVVPRPDLETEAMRFARELAALPATAMAASKYALNRAIDRGLSDGLAFELDLWHRLFATADQKEGMAAFLEKRPLRVAVRAPGATERHGFPWEGTGRREGPE